VGRQARRVKLRSVGGQVHRGPGGSRTDGSMVAQTETPTRHQG
jgi:hypothetical protein